MNNDHNPVVFISYSQDSASFADKVLEFSNKLRSEGIDTILDQYEDSPPEGWPRWMEANIDRAEFVLVIGSKGYFDKQTNKVPLGTGRGVNGKVVLSIKNCIIQTHKILNLFLLFLLTRICRIFRHLCKEQLITMLALNRVMKNYIGD